MTLQSSPTNKSYNNQPLKKKKKSKKEEKTALFPLFSLSYV